MCALTQVALAEAVTKSVMPWMCLEICNSADEIQSQLQTLVDKQDLLTAVSFEKYSLAADCAFTKLPNLTDVSSLIPSSLAKLPMISSYPHPPDFMNWMRQLFDDPECASKYINSAVSEAVDMKYSGYNLDWEPVASNTSSPITSEDALAYANFIGVFADALQKEGLELGVDVATWVTISGGPSIWNYTAIAETNVNYGISMGTYTNNDDSFMNQLNLLTEAFGPRAVVGLETVNASDGSPIVDSEVAFRFNAIEEANVNSIAIWDMPIPDNFWPYIESFLADD
eukprot:GSChrysophyteH1.ASY1.ANO1.2713.1 assembled CDS